MTGAPVKATGTKVGGRSPDDTVRRDLLRMIPWPVSAASSESESESEASGEAEGIDAVAEGAGLDPSSVGGIADGIPEDEDENDEDDEDDEDDEEEDEEDESKTD